MYSFHLSGSPWWLLLAIPGAWILWRQYAGPARGNRLLPALQIAALLLLCLSLAGPELRRHHVSFHNPAVLLLRDRSGSFAAGATLGLGGAYSDFRRRLEAAYRERRFDVKVVDFAASAWPEAGFPGAGPRPDPGPGALTSLAAPADFADSAAIPNLQAVFLFSDGRANLDSGRASRSWRVPVHPVVFPIDSLAEVQPAGVRLDGEGLEVAWETVGRAGKGPVLRILQGGRTVLTRTLPPRSGSVRLPWRPAAGDREPPRAVLRPADGEANPHAWNDTAAVRPAAGGGGRIFVLKPVRSLHERGMLSALRAEGAAVAFFSAEEAPGLGVAAEDQVWAEAGAWSAQPRLAAWLRTVPGKVVIYARAGLDGLAYGDRAAGAPPRLPGLADAWLTLPPAAEVKPSRSAAEAFPAEVVRLKALTSLPMLLPPVTAGRAAWVEAGEGARKGMLMGRLDLGQGKRAFFFGLPAVWGALSDPQGDFAVRENIAAYARAARDLAELDDGRARALLPGRAIAGLPFEAAVRLPDGAGAAFGIAGPGFSREWAAEAGATGEWKIKGIGLPRGTYRAWVRAGPDTVWTGALEAAPPEALELARLGFDEAALGEIAAQSGGSVLRPAAAGADVTPLLPTLPAAQVRVDRADSIRLHNTVATTLLILLLLSLSWFLRKKWDFD